MVGVSALVCEGRSSWLRSRQLGPAEANIEACISATTPSKNWRLHSDLSFVLYLCPHSLQPYASSEEKKVDMDLFHRESLGKDTPPGRDCQFCRHADPDFAKRDPMDRLVLSMLDDTAAAHITEDGYVKHRIAELMKKRVFGTIDAGLPKSA